MAKDSVASWFLVFNNPEEYITYKTDSSGEYIRDVNNDRIIEKSEPSEYAGLSPEEICDKVLDTWVSDSPDTKTGACAYCISAKGLKHLHIVLEDNKTFRFSAVKKLFPRAHIAPTAGNKTEAEDYINKRGKWQEKGEIVVCIRYYGEIRGKQGQRTDLVTIEKLLDDGVHPNDILLQNLKNEKFETIIKQHYFRKKLKAAPVERVVNVYWHVGATGSGKTHVLHKLNEKYPDNVYKVSDYESGYLDDYLGEFVLFLDEFRGQIRFSTFLTMLHGYTSRFHARYKNIVGLWEEVHITSVFAPEQLYHKMVQNGDQKIDTFEQLQRRITGVFYHYVSKVDNSFNIFYCPMSEYICYDKLVCDALHQDWNDGFASITPEQEEQIKFLFG